MGGENGGSYEVTKEAVEWLEESELEEAPVVETCSGGRGRCSPRSRPT